MHLLHARIAEAIRHEHRMTVKTKKTKMLELKAQHSVLGPQRERRCDA